VSVGNRQHKVDANQPEIVDALFAAGYRVQTLCLVGLGCPDLLCAKDGRMWLLEVKVPGEKLRDSQRKWHQTWAAPVAVVETVEQALAAVRF
jgi:hypothetical protein